MATVLERLDGVPLDRISARAEKLDLGRALVSLVLAVFIGIGWLVRKVFLVAAAGLRWIAAAFMEGWAMAGTKPSPGPGDG